MNQESVKQKHRIYFFGGARGVDRFYLIDALLRRKNAKVLHTGNLLHSIITDLGLGSLDRVSLREYYRVVEPAAVREIIAHLEHDDVILDTHFHYLVPGISVHNLARIARHASNATVVLVESAPEDIYARNKDGDEWFAKLENIRADVELNALYYDIYARTLGRFLTVKRFRAGPQEEGVVAEIP